MDEAENRAMVLRRMKSDGGRMRVGGWTEGGGNRACKKSLSSGTPQPQPRPPTMTNAFYARTVVGH